MNINGKHYRTIWLNDNDDTAINIIDQRYLPHQFVIEQLKTVSETIVAIKEMHVRGAGLIGATAAFGMYLATIEASEKNDFNQHINNCAQSLKTARPTSVNPVHAVNKQLQAINKATSIEEKIKAAKITAIQIADEDANWCFQIGKHGFEIIKSISETKNGEPVNILTHCNAGWLAFVDYGSATAPIYQAFDNNINVHVWIDETRPRNQGAALTAWELLNHGVPHTVIADNAGGHLMQHGMIDMVITGADRVTRSGDAANKIGTYLKALAAADNNIPFYVALPSTTFDWNICNGLTGIEIEERDPNEIKYIEGLCDNEIKKILITPKETNAKNFGFDVTPSRLITGLIKERGVCKANEAGIFSLFSEYK